jgi:hypothetical protein
MMFVGIESYSNTVRERCTATIYDTFLKRSEFESHDAHFWKWVTTCKTPKRSPFWQWVRIISTQVEEKAEGLQPMTPQETFSHIAYSNLLKCQVRRLPSSGETKETVLAKSKYQVNTEVCVNCIQKAGWIYREIVALDAKNIIVFAGSERNSLARIFLNYEPDKTLTRFDNTNYKLKEEEQKKVETKNLYLMNLRDGKRRFIITNHPQGTPTVVRDKIVEIIKGNVSGNPWKMPQINAVRERDE